MQKGTITMDIFLLMVLVQSLAERFADVSNADKGRIETVIDILHQLDFQKTRRADPVCFMF